MQIDGINLDKNNPEFFNAVEFIKNTNRHLFLTGKAGTGKTTFLKYLKTSLNKNSVVLAYTGVAAVNAGGNTINSFFKIRPSVYYPEDNRLRVSAGRDTTDSSTIFDHIRLDKKRVEIIKKMELLIIDEVSMLRCDLLDVVDKILRVYRKSLSQPFGGVQIILIGDLFQLPPIAQYSEWEILGKFYKTPFFFSSKAVESLIKSNKLAYIELKKIYRQTEQDFVNILNRVRINEISDNDLKVINDKYSPTFNKSKNKNFITLATHNRIVNQENKIELDKLPGESTFIDAEITGSFPVSMYPTDIRLELKKDAQVMFLKNDTGDSKRYYNGKIGRLTKISEGFLLIETEDDTINLKKNEWENIKYEWDSKTRRIVEKVEGTFTQFPVRLAWAVTVHKSQGLTFENVIADLGGAWDSGQVYVALSRCTSFNGLILKSKISRENIITDQEVISFSKNETPNTLILEALKESQADRIYKECRDALKKGQFEKGYDLFLKAIKRRNDIESDTFKRFIFYLLNKLNLRNQQVIEIIPFLESELEIEKSQSQKTTLYNQIKVKGLESKISQQSKSLIKKEEEITIMRKSISEMTRTITNLKKEVNSFQSINKTIREHEDDLNFKLKMQEKKLAEVNNQTESYRETALKLINRNWYQRLLNK